MKNKLLKLGACAILVSVFMIWGDVYAIDLLDGKLVIHGKLEQDLLMRTHGKQRDDLYDYDIFNFRSTLKLETRWDAFEGENFDLTFYSVFKEFYDKAYDIDSGYHNYLHRFSGHRGVEEIRSYETFRDICRELYVQLTHDDFQLRVGKQIVSWGETGYQRMADIINPTDARGLINAGYPDFDEMKRGLWMTRLFITPYGLPGDLSFDLLIIPDFQPMRLFPAGHHLMRPPEFNQLRHPNDALLARYRDRPSSWSSPEIGFRIKGIAFGTDWTIQYFHHRNDSPLTREGRLIKSMLPSLTGRGRSKGNLKYYWQDTVGATFSKPIDKKFTIIPFTDVTMSGSILRGEFITEIGRKVNRYEGIDVNVVGKARYAGVLGWDTKIYVPWLTPWNRNKYLQSGTQLFMEWMPKRHRTESVYPYVPFREKGHHFASITETLQYGFWEDRIMTVLYTEFQLTDGSMFYSPAFIFKPTFKWTYEVTYVNFIEQGSYQDNIDYLIFSIIYEF